MTHNSAAFRSLRSQIIACRSCPRLVEWRTRVAREKVKRFSGEQYWGKPVPGFGDPAARLVIVGLAPAAHGANRTGRMFTGDRSGEWLYGALHRFGFSSEPRSEGMDDSLKLYDCYITAAVRCAPPDNRPTRAEEGACRPFLKHEIMLLSRASVVLGLGKTGFDAAVTAYSEILSPGFHRRPVFGHGKVYHTVGMSFIASYHPSQQNTFTGRLTEPMFNAVFAGIRRLLDDA